MYILLGISVIYIDVPLQNFAHPPSVADWARFLRYSSRVRSLTFECEGDGKVVKAIISREVLHDLAQTRPVAHLFPNSTTLIWRPLFHTVNHANFNFHWKDTDACLFMHPGIETFQLALSHHLHLTSEVSRHRFLIDIPCRMPNLTHIAITTKISPGTLDDQLYTLISQLPKLKWVTLPACHLAARILEALSKLPVLDTLDYGFAEPPFLPALTTLAPLNTDAGLRSLLHLETLDRYGDICDLLRLTPKLTTLVVVSNHTWETTESLQILLEVVSDQCKELSTLHLDSTTGPSSFRSRLASLLHRESGVVQPITLQTLHPLTCMSALAYLDISDTNTLALSLSEVETLLSSLPELKSLHLNRSPLCLREATFGLEILPAVGRHCKKLEEFSTFFDATRPIPNLPADNSGEDMFPALAVFLVSVSIISQQVLSDVGIYMSRILPIKCEFLVVRPSWPGKSSTNDSESVLRPHIFPGTYDMLGYLDDRNLKDLHAVTDHRLDLWCSVGNMIPPLRQLRLEEQDKAKTAVEQGTRALEREILELRQRLERLESKTLLCN